MIYFAHNKARNAVKIGFSENSERRFLALQTVSLDPLELIGEIDGDRDTEKALHTKFKKFNIRGEWFLIGPELAEFIKDNVAPLTICGTEIKSFYLAGKFENPDWRDMLIGSWSKGFGSIDHKDCINDWIKTQPTINFKRNPGGRSFKIRYTGPFFAGIDKDNIGKGPHMYSTETVSDENGNKYAKIDHHDVAVNCMVAIRQADLIFAWIDSWDCFGTLTEIGYAAALEDKIVVVATSEFDRELWFAYTLADRFIIAPNPNNAWHVMWDGNKNNDFGFDVKDEINDEMEKLYKQEVDLQEEESRNGSCDIA